MHQRWMCTSCGYTAIFKPLYIHDLGWRLVCTECDDIWGNSQGGLLVNPESIAYRIANDLPLSVTQADEVNTNLNSYWTIGVSRHRR